MTPEAPSLNALRAVVSDLIAFSSPPTSGNNCRRPRGGSRFEGAASRTGSRLPERAAPFRPRFRRGLSGDAGTQTPESQPSAALGRQRARASTYGGRCGALRRPRRRPRRVTLSPSGCRSPASAALGRPRRRARATGASSRGGGALALGRSHARARERCPGRSVFVSFRPEQ